MGEELHELKKTSRFGRICFLIFVALFFIGVVSFISSIGKSWREFADAFFIGGIFIIPGFIFWYIGFRHDKHLVEKSQQEKH